MTTPGTSLEVAATPEQSADSKGTPAPNPRAILGEILQATKKAFGRKLCLCPPVWKAQCTGSRIINAHTVPRSGSLKKIARESRVYHLTANVISLVDSGGDLTERLLGIGEASTVTGFCGYHDRTIFSPVENQPFEATQEHAFLLGYRAICRELFAKQASNNLNSERLADTDAGSLWQHPWVRVMLNDFQQGLDSGLRDLNTYKAESDQMLVMSDFSQVQFYVVRFDAAPTVMCSGAFEPQFDLQGGQLQSLTDLDRIADKISFSLIGTESGGAAVFSWTRDESSACIRFIRSLDALSDKDLPDALLRVAFEYLENVYMAPDWWEGLDHEIRQGFHTRMMPKLQTAGTLADEGLRIAGWRTSLRETIAW